MRLSLGLQSCLAGKVLILGILARQGIPFKWFRFYSVARKSPGETIRGFLFSLFIITKWM
jgi:hypothetical protein